MPAISVGTTEADTSPEAELKSFTVLDGFEVSLWASEKDGLTKPISMRWDERGRLWVITAKSYPQPEPGARDQKRVAETIRLIETEADRPISLEELAGAAATSRYHFLRIFRAVAGMTPYQYVLRTRLHRAAVRLRTTSEPVSAIALDAGFADLSTFNRRFRKVMGVNPSAYRAAGL